MFYFATVALFAAGVALGHILTDRNYQHAYTVGITSGRHIEIAEGRRLVEEYRAKMESRDATRLVEAAELSQLNEMYGAR